MGKKINISKHRPYIYLSSIGVTLEVVVIKYFFFEINTEGLILGPGKPKMNQK